MDGWKIFLDWTQGIAWPLTVLIVSLLYLKPIYALLHNLGEIANRATKQPFKLSAGDFKLEFKKAVEEKKPKDVKEAISAAAEVAEHYIPEGFPVPNKKGFVTSPYAPYDGYVDVRGFPTGTEVKDPYAPGKIFRVP